MNLDMLKQVIVDQKEEMAEAFNKERLIEREKAGKCKKLVDTNFIKVVTGVRRCGKSILSMQLLGNKNYGYLNFDDERLAGIGTEDLNNAMKAFYELYGDIKIVFFDEIQNIKGWELFVNRLKREGINVIITGSNAKMLSRELATHLTGRHMQIELFPFSFMEFLRYNNVVITKEIAYSTKKSAEISRQLEEYVRIGGFPEAVKNKDISRAYLSGLYSTILTKDIILRQNIKMKKTFSEIANYIISNFSNKITYNKIKNIFALKSAHTVASYASYLEEAYLIFLVNKFSYKAKEIHMSPKKVYVIDSGLVNSIAFKTSENIGNLMENVVAIELKRRVSDATDMQIYYWNDYSGKEVDFVVRNETKATEAIQVCYRLDDPKTKQREIRSLVSACKALRLKNGLIITGDFEGEEKVSGMRIAYKPLWKWLLGF